jgi:DNA-binding LacI/PurR family transcriptional regulator
MTDHRTHTRTPDAAGRRPTIADVARVAGVSASTASLTFSGSAKVTAGTRERVFAAARDLGYSGPDPLARSLRRGRCDVVAVIVGEQLGYAFHDPMMVSTLDGLADEVGAMGSSLLLAPVRTARSADAERLARLPMDAAVLLDCEIPSGALLALLRGRGVPVVGVDGPVGVGVPLVGIDDEGGTALLVEHLVALGHRRFGVVTMPLALDGVGGPLTEAELSGAGPGELRLRASRSSVALRRIAGVRTCLDRVPGASASFVEAAWNLVADGERAAGDLLDAAAATSPAPTDPAPADRPTALVAQSDVLALGCLRAAAARGLEVPRDLSVVGFDGVELSLLGGTRLTTIEQPAVEKGRATGGLLRAVLDGVTPDDIRLPVHLRVGSTTGPAPGA